MLPKANLFFGLLFLWFYVIYGATLSSVTPATARYTGGTPVKFTGTGLADGAKCFWALANVYTVACISSPTSGTCLTPRFTGSAVVADTLRISQHNVLSNSVGFTWNPAAALPTYSTQISVRTVSAGNVGTVGSSIPINVTLSVPLPCRPVQFSLSHPHATFNVPYVTFNVGDTWKPVTLTFVSAQTYPQDTYPISIIAQSNINPFSLDYEASYFFSYLKTISVSCPNVRTEQGTTVTATITLSAASLVSFTLVPTGSFIFTPKTLTFAPGVKTATLQVTPKTSGTLTMTLTPSIVEYAPVDFSFAVSQKSIKPTVPSYTIAIGNRMDITLTLSKAPSSPLALAASANIYRLLLTPATIGFVAGATQAILSVKGLLAGPDVIYIDSPTTEYENLRIPITVVPKTITVSAIPATILVGNAFNIQFTLSSAPSSTLVLTPTTTSSTTCYTAGIVTIIPPATTASLLVTPTCSDASAALTFDINLEPEFKFIPFALPRPTIKSISLAVPQTQFLGVSQTLTVTLSATPKSNLVITLTDTANAFVFTPASISFLANTGVLQTTVTVLSKIPATSTITATPNLNDEFALVERVVTILQKYITLALSTTSIYVGNKATLNITLSSVPSSGLSLALTSTLGASFTPSKVVFINTIFAQVIVSPTEPGQDEISVTSTPTSEEYVSAPLTYLAFPKIARATAPTTFLRGSVTVTFSLSLLSSSDITLTLSCYNCDVSSPAVVIPATALTATVVVTPVDSGPAWLTTTHDHDNEFTRINTLYWNSN